jgi:nitrogen regulatory protein P-II 1
MGEFFQNLKLRADKQVDPVEAIVRKNGCTGYSGDGMIIVSPVDEMYKMRANEQGIIVV